MRDPQGAPRGFLSYWMLNRVSRSPTYGFEILREIETKTEGAWRPGPGSVYPLLKRMVRLGYVESKTVKGERADQHLYKITKEGSENLRKAIGTFRMMSKRWSSMRGIFVDLVQPESVPEFVLAGSRNQFELVKRIIEVNSGRVPETDLRSMLGEYSALLESQLGWVNRELQQAPVAARRRS
jgi:DNA-binding PadR family transcriptional regulator